MRCPTVAIGWFAAIVAVLVVPAGCKTQRLASAATGRRTKPIVTVRDVRVLIADSHDRCRVRADGPWVVRDGRGRERLRGDGGAWLIIHADAHRNLRIGPDALGSGVFSLHTEPGGVISLAVPKRGDWSPARRYAGSMRVSADLPDRLRVINDVDIETYVACVLPGEIFPHFDREAFLAQVVAARTYVLYQMAQRANNAYDVASTEASQVYPGLASGKVAQKAREAAEATRGIVATWSSPGGDRIFCTFYSSCCGGRTQNVANCRTDVPSIPPLAGEVRCRCLNIAKGSSYQWDPVTLSKSEITSKLVGRYPKFKDLGRVESVNVAERTRSGRPRLLRIRGRRGKEREMFSEDFRLAVGSRVLRSTNCRIRNLAEHVEFRDGRGFGHGMGMCQWGMQEMALRGHFAAAILKHYYPTMSLTRAY